MPSYVKDLKPEERVAILASQNYVIYQQAIEGINLVEKIMDDYLKRKFGPEKIKTIKEHLLYSFPSHGTNVTCEDLKNLGFEVEPLGTDSQLGNMLIEYHRRALKALIAEVQPGSRGVTLFENEKVSYQHVITFTQIPVLPQSVPPKKD